LDQSGTQILGSSKRKTSPNSRKNGLKKILPRSPTKGETSSFALMKLKKSKEPLL
jgi:hypothetical protein